MEYEERADMAKLSAKVIRHDRGDKSTSIESETDREKTPLKTSEPI